MREFELRTVAIRAAIGAIRLVQGVGGPLKPIADQVIRAAGHVPLGIAEGNGLIGRSRKHHFRTAYASALEASTGIEVLVGVDAVDADAAEVVQADLDQTRRMVWKLMR